MPASFGMDDQPTETCEVSAVALNFESVPEISQDAAASLRISARKCHAGSSSARSGLRTWSMVSSPPSAMNNWCGRAGTPRRRGRYSQLTRSCSSSSASPRRITAETILPETTSAAVGRAGESTSSALESQPTMTSPRILSSNGSLIWSIIASVATNPRIAPSTTRNDLSRAVSSVLPLAPGTESSRSSSVRPGFQMNAKMVAKALRKRVWPRSPTPWVSVNSMAEAIA